MIRPSHTHESLCRNQYLDQPMYLIKGLTPVFGGIKGGLGNAATVLWHPDPYIYVEVGMDGVLSRAPHVEVVARARVARHVLLALSLLPNLQEPKVNGIYSGGP